MSLTSALCSLFFVWWSTSALRLPFLAPARPRVSAVSIYC